MNGSPSSLGFLVSFIYFFQSPKSPCHVLASPSPPSSDVVHRWVQVKYTLQLLPRGMQVMSNEGMTISVMSFFLPGSDSQFVLSQPPSVSVSSGNTAKLYCIMVSSYSISAYYMDWYQQKPGNPPYYLLRYYSDSNQQQGSGVPSRFSAYKDTSTNTFFLSITGV